MHLVTKCRATLGLGLFVVSVALISAAFPAARAHAVAVPIEADSKEDDKADAFRVLSTMLNAETDKPEICLNLSHPIANGDREGIRRTLTLYQDGVRQDIKSEALSLTPSDICIQQLAFHHQYKLLMKNLVSAEDQDLDKPFKISFSVPDRKPALNFLLGDQLDPQRLRRLGADDKLSLRAMNVTGVHVALYAIKDPKKWALAWQQIAQNNLAPSESRTFAMQNGEKVWETDLDFGDKSNVSQTAQIALPARDQLKPGLYFLAARQRGVDDQEATALLAGKWVRIGSARFEALRAEESASSEKKAIDKMVVFANDVEKKTPLAGASVRVMTRDGASVADGKTDASGIATLDIDHARSNDDLLIALDSENAGMDLGDSARLPVFAAQAQAGGAHILPLFSKAVPGQTLAIALWADDAQGSLQRTDASSLKLLRPDDGFYSEARVAGGNRGVQTVQLQIPLGAASGRWSLMWQKDDGQVLTRVPFDVGAAGEAARLDLRADRTALDRDGVVGLTVKLQDAAGKPMPWHQGTIVSHRGSLSLPGWDGYAFGLADNRYNDNAVVATFLTGADGTARIKPVLALDDPHAAQGSSMTLTAQVEDMPRAQAQLSLPIRTSGGWVGIKSAMPGAVFPENGLAHFSLAAVDGAGKRKSLSDLYYQVYEEGRSFSWYQSEGRWAYKPLPFHRRVGGGRLAISGQADTVLVWPVTAGHYVLEITDADGDVLARQTFEAGGSPQDTAIENDPRLRLEADGDASRRFTVFLTQPARLFMIAGDGSVETLSPRAAPAGKTAIDVPMHPHAEAKENKDDTRLWVLALFADGSRAQASVDKTGAHALPRWGLDVQASAAAPTADAKGTDHVNLAVQLVHHVAKNAPQTQVSLVAVPRDENGVAGMPIQMGPQKMAADGKTGFHLTTPAFNGKLEIHVVAWDETQVVDKTLSFPVKEALQASSDFPPVLRPGDKTSLNVRLTRSRGPDGLYRYTLSVPDALAVAPKVLSGAVGLKKGGVQTLSFPVEAKRLGSGTIYLDLTGPSGLHQRYEWPTMVVSDDDEIWTAQSAKIEGQGFLSLPLKVEVDEKNKKTDKPEKIEKASHQYLLAPFALPTFLPEALDLFVHTDPVTTVDIAHWVAAVPLWHEQIAALGLMSEEGLDRLVTQRLAALASRQRDDGGFVSWPSDKEGDVLSTALALPVLEKAYPSVAVVGARWLRHKLENAWFDDAERPVRSEAAFALSHLSQQTRDLAQASDPAPLRYLADTSRDKSLPPLAAANLAGALAAIGDQDRARFWIARAQSGLSLPAEVPDGRVIWASFARLAANPFADLGQLLPAMEKAANPLTADTPLEANMLLAAYGAAGARVGTWHIQLAGEDKKIYGIWPLPPMEKSAVISLRNPVTEGRYVLQMAQTKAPSGAAEQAHRGAENASVQRVFYTLDGTRLSGEKLTYGESYLVVVRGTATFDKNKNAKDRDAAASAPVYRIVVGDVPALAPVRSASEAGEAFVSLWPWLGNASGPVRHTAFDAGIRACDVQAKAGSFQCVYLVKAFYRGTFALPPVQLFNDKGDVVPAAQSEGRLTISGR